MNDDVGFNRLVVSSDQTCFLEFAPIVSKSWRTLFPNISLTLAYVTDDVSLLEEMKKLFDDVIVFNPINGVPTANLAKIARRYACTMYGNDVCMIEDIDTAPLRSDYVINYAKQRKLETLGLVGLEVYKDSEHYGKVPASNSVAESHIWKRVINPKNLEFKEWVTSLKGIRVFDDKEDPYCSTNAFSDESLMRALINTNCVGEELITHIIRSCSPRKDWIDRSWWSIDYDRLKNHEYTMVNFMRPIDNRAQPVVDHIFNSLKK
jgi:hypothetical protein